MDALALVEAERESSVQRKTVDDKSDSLLTEIMSFSATGLMRKPLGEFDAIPVSAHGAIS